MNESERHTVDVLNRLHEAEMHSVLPRLSDLQVSASHRTAAHAQLLRRLAAQSLEHREWLIEAIEAEGGAVWPVSLDTSTAMLHYLSVSTVLPLVIRDLAKLLREYDTAAQARPLSTGAADVIRRIGRRYTDALEQLKAAAGGADSAPSSALDAR